MGAPAGVIALGEGADVGDRKKASRRRATGTREHIAAYLADTHGLFDPGGMASMRLVAAVGYPGSSVAFAQLLCCGGCWPRPATRRTRAWWGPDAPGGPAHPRLRRGQLAGISTALMM
jgi:hypothetical protein